jgi:hypothetical protein
MKSHGIIYLILYEGMDGEYAMVTVCGYTALSVRELSGLRFGNILKTESGQVRRAFSPFRT